MSDSADRATPSLEARPRARLLSELSHVQVEDYLAQGDTVLVPCGATEQHGAHLPLGVDAMTAIAVATDAAAATGVLLAPPLWYGWSPHHMGFAGTVSLRPETLTALAEDVAVSLLHHGFRRVLFVNGHRLANLPPLSIAATRVRNDTGALVAVADLAHLAQPEYAAARESEGASGIGHADGYETAHMLHIHPGLVDQDQVGASLAGTPDETQHPAMRTIDPSAASTRVAWWPSTEAEILASGSGVSGDPTWGTADRGRLLHEAMVRDLVALVRQVQGATVDVTRPGAPR